MRSWPVIPLVLLPLVSCTAVDRQSADASMPPTWQDWPFDQPAWADFTPKGNPTEIYAGKPMVGLKCQFVVGGGTIPLLAARLGLAGGGVRVLEPEPAAALSRMVRQFRGTNVLGTPGGYAYESQSGCVGLRGPALATRFYFRSTAVTFESATVEFAAELARRGDDQEWDLGRSWSVRDRRELRVGQALVRFAGVDERGDAGLVIVHLGEVRSSPPGDDALLDPAGDAAENVASATFLEGAEPDSMR